MIRHNFMPRQVATFDAHRMSNQPLYQFESMARPRALLADLPPSPDCMALAELRLAQIVLEARIQASANMSNFFRQQNTVAPRDFPLLSKPRGFEALTRASIPSDDASVATEKQSLSDKSEQSSLDCSSTHEESKQTVYVDTIRDTDVLCGRGGRSNHHAGNKRYRHVISDMKLMYKKSEAKAIKTDLSRAIVDHVCKYGGRFIKKEVTTGRYYVLTRGEARKKTSQALREAKALKWTV